MALTANSGPTVVVVPPTGGGGGEGKARQPIPIEDLSDPDPITTDLWGCIAVKCTLNPDDFKEGVSGPKECAFMVPRQGFLFSHLRTIRENFSSLVKVEEYLWFSADVATMGDNGSVGTAPSKHSLGLGGGEKTSANSLSNKERVPVPWQYPVSVVFDILRAKDETNFHFGQPLRLTVNYSHPEKAPLLHVKTNAREGDAFVYYNQMIKEAVTLRHGTVQPLVTLKKDYNEYYRLLISGLKACDGTMFHKGKMALRFVGDRTLTETHYPVIVHADGRSRRLRIPASKRTFGQMLHYCVPSFSSMTEQEWSSPFEARGVAVQGMCPLYNTPLDVLYDLFGSVDLCLHVVVSPSARVMQH